MGLRKGLIEIFRRPKKVVIAFKPISEAWVIVEALVKREPILFLIDTGANCSIIRKEVSERLRLEIGKGSGVSRTWHGKIDWETVKTECLEFAEGIIVEMNFFAIEFPDHFCADKATFDGILGDDFLRSCRAVIDYRKRTLTLCGRKRK